MDITKGYSIAYKGLKNGTHDFAFKVGGALFEAYGSAEIMGGDCDVEVKLDKSETQLVADVTIRGGVVVACDRCLEECRVPVDFEGRLLVKFSDEVREYDGEILWLLPGEDEVDLAQYIYESIVLSLPYQRVHPDVSASSRTRSSPRSRIAPAQSPATRPGASSPSSRNAWRPARRTTKSKYVELNIILQHGTS